MCDTLLCFLHVFLSCKLDSCLGVAYNKQRLPDANYWNRVVTRSRKTKLNQDMKKYINTVAVIAALGVLASCSTTTTVQQPKRASQGTQASAPQTVAAPSNIDNMVYKERGVVIFTTGRSNSDGSYYSTDGGEGSHYGPSTAINCLSYRKTGAKTAQISRSGGHSGSSTFLRFTTPTSGYVYREETSNFRYGDESVSTARIPFTLEHR